MESTRYRITKTTTIPTLVPGFLRAKRLAGTAEPFTVARPAAVLSSFDNGKYCGSRRRRDAASQKQTYLEEEISDAIIGS
jgi:hypothetical protein